MFTFKRIAVCISMLTIASAALAQAPQFGQGDHSHCHACTAFLFERWFRVLEVEGLDRLPLAFVAQNGLDDDQAAGLTLVKTVTNDNGGTAVPIPRMVRPPEMRSTVAASSARRRGW